MFLSMAAKVDLGNWAVCGHQLLIASYDIIRLGCMCVWPSLPTAVWELSSDVLKELLLVALLLRAKRTRNLEVSVGFSGTTHLLVGAAQGIVSVVVLGIQLQCVFQKSRAKLQVALLQLNFAEQEIRSGKALIEPNRLFQSPLGFVVLLKAGISIA